MTARSRKALRLPDDLRWELERRCHLLGISVNAGAVVAVAEWCGWPPSRLSRGKIPGPLSSVRGGEPDVTLQPTGGVSDVTSPPTPPRRGVPVDLDPEQTQGVAPESKSVPTPGGSGGRRPPSGVSHVPLGFCWACHPDVSCSPEQLSGHTCGAMPCLVHPNQGPGLFPGRCSYQDSHAEAPAGPATARKGRGAGVSPIAPKSNRANQISQARAASHFDMFWTCVPKKVGKKAAQRQYRTALRAKGWKPRNKDDGLDQAASFLLVAVSSWQAKVEADRRLRGDEAFRFCKSPENWLKGGHYDDEETEAAPKRAGGGWL